MDIASVANSPNPYVHGFQFSRRMEQLKIVNKLDLTIISQPVSEKFLKVLKKLKLKKLGKKLSGVPIASDEISQLELDQIIDIDILFLDSNYTNSLGC